MQTEDKQDQATEQASVEHFHIRLFTDGEIIQDVANSLSVTRLVRLVHKTLKLCTEAAGGELAELAEAGENDAAIGRAFLRAREVGQLTDMFDPTLFDHPLFEDGEGYQVLLRTAFLTLMDDALESVQITEGRTMSVVTCSLSGAECPPFAKYLEKKASHKCEGCGGNHPRSHAVAVDEEGNELGRFDLPDPTGATTFADMVEMAGEGLAEMLRKQGIAFNRVPEDNVAD